MVFGGIISILIAIWIFRTAREAKTGHTFYWVLGSVITFLVVQFFMMSVNAGIIEFFDGDVSDAYDNAGGLNSRDNSDTAGLQTGVGGSFIGVLFEIIPWATPFFIIAIARLVFMLKQPLSFMALFGGIKEMFVAIGDSFKTSDQEASVAKENNSDDSVK
ncbi:MAG: hypothetical protein KAG26_03920 [Methylococcales bacterium]|nr:hypothetical protein [Methylococcales bacterium]